MRSIVTVTSANATPFRLTTVQRVKSELNITTPDFDALLQTKIEEAGSDIVAYVRYPLAKETVSETFRDFGWQPARALLLDRQPIVSVSALTIDDVALAGSEYEIDAKAGMIYRLDTSGYPCPWSVYKAAAISYIGGYVLPGNSGANLEPAIEGACVELVKMFWWARQRDPMIKAEDVPGVMSLEYWVGSLGEEGELPPSVKMRLAPFRRPSV